ncbi:DUF6531 domain-containing protein, partial [Sulfurirhabdus autotrophica]
EIDYIGTGPFPLQLTRAYNSQQEGGGGWRWSYGGRIDSTGIVYRPDGKVITFTLTNGTWLADKDITDTLVQLANASGWKYTTGEGVVETYNANGARTSFTNRAGLTQTYTYSTGSDGNVILDANGNLTTTALPAGYPIRITDAAGRAINIAWGYDSTNTIIRLTKLTDPANGIYLWGYDTINLTSITYPDGSIRQYSYNEQTLTGNANLPHALTGITEKANSADPGTRFASYWYDSQGRAYKEEHAPSLNQGIDNYQLTYNTDPATGNPTSTVVTDPLKTAYTYNFTTVLGVAKSTGTDQLGGSGCSAASSALTYDANGNVSSRTDFNQHKTCYAYDTLGRNLETARVEGLASTADCATALTATSYSGEIRKTSTSWHTTWRLATKITEPGRETSITYDPASGNVLTQEIKDTASSKTRTWTYSYTTSADNTLVNLLKSVDGPRTDVNDITRYTYYTADDTTTTPPKYRRGDLNTLSN